MAGLPTIAELTTPPSTHGLMRGYLSQLRSYLSGLLGDDGTVATALLTLGVLAGSYVAKTAAYTVLVADRGKLIDASGTWTLALPTVASAGAGFSFVVRNSGTGTITLDGASAETVDGAATLALAAGRSALVMCTGAAWLTLGLAGLAGGATRAVDGTAAAPGLTFAADDNTGFFRPAADQIGATTGGVQRALLTTTALQIAVPITGLAVTQSPTDTTSGRLLKTGDFGLGGSAVALPGDDLNTGQVNGTFSFTSSALNAPGAASNGILVVHARSPTISAVPSQMQTVFKDRSGGGFRAWMRMVTASTFGDWREILHQGSVLGTVSQSAGIPTGAMIERGSNANGEYVRFADGTQICVRSDLSAANASTALGSLFRSADIAWTFPAAFVATTGLIVTGDADDADVWLTSNTLTATTTNLRVLSGATKASAINCRAIAIGRWF